MTEFILLDMTYYGRDLTPYYRNRILIIRMFHLIALPGMASQTVWEPMHARSGIKTDYFKTFGAADQ